jgi:chromosome segregation ATPase
MEGLNLWVTTIGGILTISVIVVGWGPPLKRFRVWLYQRTPFHRIDQLQKRVDDLEASQERTWGYAETIRKITDNVEKIGDAQALALQAQLRDYRTELTQVDNALRDLTQRLINLHLSSEHPDDLTTTEELREQIRALQTRSDDLTEIVSTGLNDVLWSSSPAAQRLKQAAKAERERKGVSDWPALPGSS